MISEFFVIYWMLLHTSGGIQLGIPKNKLDEFQNLDDPLSEVISYWLYGNVKGDPMSWETIINAHKTEHVDELGLATIIQDKHCKSSYVRIIYKRALTL